MTRESILEWTRRQPFEPFVLKVSNGEQYEIRHPDMIVPTHDYVVVGIPDPTHSGSRNHVAERATWVSMLHIVELTAMRNASQAGNGRTKKK